MECYWNKFEEYKDCHLYMLILELDWRVQVLNYKKFLCSLCSVVVFAYHFFFCWKHLLNNLPHSLSPPSHTRRAERVSAYLLIPTSTRRRRQGGERRSSLESEMEAELIQPFFMFRNTEEREVLSSLYFYFHSVWPRLTTTHDSCGTNSSTLNISLLLLFSFCQK